MMLLGHGIRDRGMLKGVKDASEASHHDLEMAAPLSEPKPRGRAARCV